MQARPKILSRPLPKQRRLSQGRWKPAIADALERVLEYSGEGEPNYSTLDPPVVVFGFEDVAINGHLGEAIFRRMVRRAEFRFSPAWWDRIPQQYGRSRIEAGYRGFMKSETRSWPVNPFYKMYRKGMLRTYRIICEEAGFAACHRWIASLLMNYGEAELRRYSRATLIEELNRPIGIKIVEDIPEDPSPEYERTGIRLIPEMSELFAQLRRRGFDLWIMSTSNDWSDEVFASAIGVDISRVLGIRVKVNDGILGEEPLIPIPTGEGAAEALTLFIGRVPVLVVASPRDKKILGYGNGMRVVVVQKPLDPKTSREWRGRGWFIQPAFSPIATPQRLLGTVPTETEKETPP